MSMHGEKEKRKRKEKGHLAFQVPFLHVLAQSHESGTNGELTSVPFGHADFASGRER